MDEFQRALRRADRAWQEDRLGETREALATAMAQLGTEMLLPEDGGAALAAEPGITSSTFITPDAENGSSQATEPTNAPGDGAGTSTPSAYNLSDDDYSTQSHNSTDHERRTGLKAAENHASWRAVARACHVDPGLGADRR